MNNKKGKRRTDAGDDGFGGEHVACRPCGLDKGGADVDGDSCHVLTLGRNGEGTEGVRERHDKPSVHSLTETKKESQSQSEACTA